MHRSTDIIAKLPTHRSNAFMISCREFYLEAAKQVKKRFNLSCPVLSSLRLLHPEKGKGAAAHSVLMLSEHFSQVIPLEKHTLPQREWITYKAAENDHLLMGNERTAPFFGQRVGKMCCVDGEQRFPLLSKFCKAMLIILHASADVERDFSDLAMTKSQLRSSMGDRLLQSLLTISRNRGSTTCLTFQPTAEMRTALK